MVYAAQLSQVYHAGIGMIFFLVLTTVFTSIICLFSLLLHLRTKTQVKKKVHFFHKK